MQFHAIEHDVVDSTSERAFAALAAGVARHGDVHIAREQTAGRGRRGASWFSARDTGLYLSVVLLPERSAHPAALTMAGGLAVRDAVKALGVVETRLKWPNDVVVGADAAKLAGVLVETRGLDAARPHYVLGLGVNVAQREFPAELLAQRTVTSFAARGLDLSVSTVRDAVLASLATRLDEALAGSQRLCNDFLDALELANARVEVECGDERIEGVLAGISLDGLTIRAADGAARRCALEHVRSVRAT